MEKNLQYTGMQLDRADALRRQPAVIEELWRGEHSYIVPMYQGKSLFQIDTPGAGQLQPVFVRRGSISEFVPESSQRVFLGQSEDKHYFAVEITGQQREILCEQFQAKFIDLRSVGAVLTRDVAALLAYARGLMFWRQQNYFCSRCGSGFEVLHGGHVLKCLGVDCRRENYPRTDPAVIMLVERIGPGGVQQCLLGRHPHWPAGSFSTLAGFVEPGESLEEAVRREVEEESGVKVGEVSYVASQPWPFPASIMLGFFAEALESDIVLDPHELAEADWFSREELAEFGEWGDEASEHNLPRHDSISRFLIDEWLDSGHSS